LYGAFPPFALVCLPNAGRETPARLYQLSFGLLVRNSARFYLGVHLAIPVLVLIACHALCCPAT
jgi:hypothetical protein